MLDVIRVVDHDRGRITAYWLDRDDVAIARDPLAQAIKGLVINIDVVPVRRSGWELELVGFTGHAWLRMNELERQENRCAKYIIEP